MLSGLFSLVVIAICLWIVVNIGAKSPNGVKKVNAKIAKITHNAPKRVLNAGKELLKDPKE